MSSDAVKLLKKLYSRLPIVREIHTIRGVVMRMEGLAEKRTRKQLNEVDYHPELSWNETVYFGASLKAFELLGREFEFRLVGCELHAVNAFFVREDLCSSEFAEPFAAENHYEPPRYRVIRRDGHARGFSDMP